MSDPREDEDLDLEDIAEAEAPDDDETEAPEAEAAEAPEADDDGEDLAAVEAQARKYGWRPREKFGKNAPGWVDAKRFLELPSTAVKMMRDEKRELEDRLNRIERTSMVAVERARKIERERYEAELDRIRQAKAAAVETADTERYKALDRMEREMKPPADPVVEQRPQSAPPELMDYAQKTPWMQDPDAMRLAATLVQRDDIAMTLPPLAQAKWAEQRVKEYMPHLFRDADPAPRRQTQSRVDPGGVSVGGGMKRGKSAADLPKEAREVARQLVSEGIFKSADEYAQAYFEEYGE